MKIKYKLTNINWDTDGEEVKLPKTITVLAVSEDEAINAATDKTGWCIKGATVKAVKPKPLTQEDAIIIKANKLAGYLRNHNKNLTKKQEEYFEELWAVMTAWDYVRKNLRAYNLDGVRQKEY